MIWITSGFWDYLDDLDYNKQVADKVQEIADAPYVETRDGDGNTQLHLAAGNGKTEIALALIKAGADINARNNDGETPAQNARRLGYLEIARAIEAAQYREYATSHWRFFN